MANLINWQNYRPSDDDLLAYLFLREEMPSWAIDFFERLVKKNEHWTKLRWSFSYQYGTKCQFSRVLRRIETRTKAKNSRYKEIYSLFFIQSESSEVELPEQSPFQKGEIWQVHDCSSSLFKKGNGQPRAVFFRHNVSPQRGYTPLLVWIADEINVREFDGYKIPFVKVYPLFDITGYSLPILKIKTSLFGLGAFPTLAIEVRTDCLAKLISVESRSVDEVFDQLKSVQSTFREYKEGRLTEKPSD